MAKKKPNNDKPKRSGMQVFYNSETDTWSNDSAEQPYLMPGTSSYKAYVEDRKESSPEQKDDEFHMKLEEDNESLRSEQVGEEVGIDAETEYVKHKQRRYMRKEVQVPKAQKIAENGLERHVPKSDFYDETYDPQVSAEDFLSDALGDHKAELDAKDREIPTFDTDHDGDVDEDDAYPTPGSKTMRKYM